jgi:hypothetical protein
MELPTDVVELNSWLTIYYPKKDFFGSPDQGLDPMLIRPNSLGLSKLYVLNRSDYLVRFGADFLSEVRDSLVFSNSTFLVFDLSITVDKRSDTTFLNELIPSTAGSLLSRSRDAFDPGFVESLKHQTQSDDYFIKMLSILFRIRGGDYTAYFDFESELENKDTLSDFDLTLLDYFGYRNCIGKKSANPKSSYDGKLQALLSVFKDSLESCILSYRLFDLNYAKQLHIARKYIKSNTVCRSVYSRKARLAAEWNYYGNQISYGASRKLPRINYIKKKRKYDVVYTYVNNDIHKFSTKRSSEFRNSGERFDDELHGEGRYGNFGEIELSLTLLNRNIDQIGQIFIVVPDNDHLVRLDKLDYEIRKRIRYVSHSELGVSWEDSTSFNSDAIESYLYKIEGLSNKFIYLNDDFFILKPFSFHKLFSRGYFLAKYSFLPRDFSTTQKAELLNHSERRTRMTLLAFEKRFGIPAPNFESIHNFYMLDREFMLEMERQYPEELSQLRASRFRTQKDIRYLELYFHTIYALGYHRPFIVSDDYFLNVKGLSSKLTNCILKSKPTFLSVNNLNEQTRESFKLLAHNI